MDFRPVAQHHRTKDASSGSRPLFVDIRLKEYTTGTPHELKGRPFLVRRAFCLNHALSTEDATPKANPNSNATRWHGQRGGWLLADRLARNVPSSTPRRARSRSRCSRFEAGWSTG